MKRIKYSLCVILLVIVVFGYSPLESTATTLNESKRVIQTNPKESTNEMDDKKIIDEKMVLHPKFNCDPRILITNIPDIDPHISLNNLP